MMYNINATIIANKPMSVMAMVMSVTPIDVVLSSVNIDARSPERRYPRTNNTTPGIPNRRSGCFDSNIQ